jgi:hydroxymethylpyrimidine pyrophosphatase-like HAD family hydrolase
MSIIICDIDGTIVNAGKYPITRHIEWLNEMAKMHKIYLVTGRPDSTRAATEQVLKNAGVHYNRLIMNNGSTRESVQFKSSVAQQLKDSGVVLAIDNDAGALRAYRRAGFKTMSPGQMVVKTIWHGVFSKLN